MLGSTPIEIRNKVSEPVFNRDVLFKRNELYDNQIHPHLCSLGKNMFTDTKEPNKPGGAALKVVNMAVYEYFSLQAVGKRVGGQDFYYIDDVCLDHGCCTFATATASLAMLENDIDVVTAASTKNATLKVFWKKPKTKIKILSLLKWPPD